MLLNFILKKLYGELYQVKKKYFIIGAAIIIVLTIATVLALNLKKKSNDESMANLGENIDTTAVVERGNIETNITGSGNVESKLVKELKTQKDGTVGNVYVSEGQKVNKEDIILELRNEEDDISINQSSLDIFEEENRLRKLKEDAENLIVKAPFSGTISEVFIEEGEEVSDNQKFVEIIDKSFVKAVASFNKMQIEKMKIGDKADIVLLGSYQTVEGKITEISEQGYGTESGGLVYDVTVEARNPGALTKDMDVQVKIKKGESAFFAVKRSKLDWKTDEIIELKIDGTLSKVYAEKDQKVNKGDVLGEIVNRDYLKDIEVQERRVQNKRLELNKKKKNLDNDIIYALISGTVIDIDVVSGENITSDRVVAKVADLDNMEVTIPVDELDILKVKKGQNAIINVSALKGVDFKGKVTNISQEGKIENGVSTFDVTISIDNPKDLKLGMSANVKILLDSKKNVLLVPVDCVSEREDKYYVKVEKNNGEVEEIEVEVGLISNDFAEITSDNLREGYKVLKETGY